MNRIEMYVDKDGSATGYSRETIKRIFKKFAGHNIILTFHKKKDKRSTEHNAYLWGHIYKKISMTSGHSAKELHMAYKRMFLGYEKEEVIDFESGERVVSEKIGSSAGLNVEQFSEFVERIKAHGGSFHGCTFDNMEYWTEENPELVSYYGFNGR